MWKGGEEEYVVGHNIWQLIYDSLADVLVQLLVRALNLKSNEQIELPTEHRAKAEQFACVSLQALVLSNIYLVTTVYRVPFAATRLRCVIDHCDISQAAHSANT